MGVVNKAIEDGIGKGRITDSGVAGVDRQLAGDDGRGAAVSVIHDLDVSCMP